MLYNAGNNRYMNVFVQNNSVVNIKMNEKRQHTHIDTLYCNIVLCNIIVLHNTISQKKLFRIFFEFTVIDEMA